MKKQNLKIEDNIKTLNSKIIKKEINIKTDEIVYEINKSLKKLQIKNLKIQKMDKSEMHLILYFESENYRECIQQINEISKILDNIILITDKKEKRLYIQEVTVSNSTTKRTNNTKIITIITVKLT
ncbi:hypothetical protein GUI12_02385 [Anaplasmataceae bacterium AB001_6]|nr:hypothetical protein GUI12_02385 [Anaplasmataceae bacterium AB001_6]